MKFAIRQSYWNLIKTCMVIDFRNSVTSLFNSGTKKSFSSSEYSTSVFIWLKNQKTAYLILSAFINT